jgi:hypothetical protein
MWAGILKTCKEKTKMAKPLNSVIIEGNIITSKVKLSENKEECLFAIVSDGTYVKVMASGKTAAWLIKLGAQYNDFVRVVGKLVSTEINQSQILGIAAEHIELRRQDGKELKWLA